MSLNDSIPSIDVPSDFRFHALYLINTHFGSFIWCITCGILPRNNVSNLFIKEFVKSVNLIVVLVWLNEVYVFTNWKCLGVYRCDVVLVWILTVIYSNVVISMLDFTIVILVTFKPLRFYWFFLQVIRSGIHTIMVISTHQWFTLWCDSLNLRYNLWQMCL